MSTRVSGSYNSVGVFYFPHMAAKDATPKELGDMLVHVVKYRATKEGIAYLKAEMMDQFEHVDAQFRATDERLRHIHSEIALIHRRIERLEEQGASNAGFAKETDHLLARVAEIEKHLGLEKKMAA